MKQKCADKAFELISDEMTVGLGGGATVALLIKKIEKEQIRIQAVTPSEDTRALCLEHNIPVLPLEQVEHIDIAFDGCDELDMDLNALKSCGGIHTREKIAASMADDYVLLADEGKIRKKLDFSYPVTIEVIRSARAYVKKVLEDMGAVVVERKADKKAGLVISDDGNYLFEAKFSDVEDIGELVCSLNRIPGIVEHSLFFGIASKGIIAKKDGIDIIEK